MEAGARPLAVHPLQTFADVAGALEALPGCAVAVTADDDDGFVLGETLGRDLGGRPFRLPDAQRPLYHAAAVFASNYLVAVSGAAEVLFSRAGVPEALAAMRPLQEATLANVHRLGPRAALTGPAVRGDAGTIESEPLGDRRGRSGAARALRGAVPCRDAWSPAIAWRRRPGPRSRRCSRDGADARRGGAARDDRCLAGGRRVGRARADDGRAARGARVADRTRTRGDRPRRRHDLREPACSSASREDLSLYPRDEASDVAMCERAGVDLVWAPTVEEVFPLGASLAAAGIRGRSPTSTRAPPDRAISRACCRSCTGCSTWSGPPPPTSARRMHSSCSWCAG